MLIALAYQSNSVSKSLEESSELAFYQVENGRIAEKYVRNPSCGNFAELAKYLARSQVDLLICGIIPESTINVMDDEGINLLHGINGNADEIVNAYLSGTLDFPVL